MQRLAHSKDLAIGLATAMVITLHPRGSVVAKDEPLLGKLRKLSA
jgi:hypothetical protein